MMARSRAGQRGTVTLELALSSLVLFSLVFGVIELGRMLWTWNAAVEATRIGARMAAVCDRLADPGAVTDNVIKARMRTRLPALQADQVVITYLNAPAPDNTCTARNCQAVRVTLTGYTHKALIPLVPVSVTLPPFTTTLRKESMNSTANPVCI